MRTIRKLLLLLGFGGVIVPPPDLTIGTEGGTVIETESGIDLETESAA